MGHEQDQWREHKMTPMEMYYSGLAEVYLSEIEDYQTPLLKIVMAKGIITEMQSDLILFMLNKKPTDKSKQQEERLKLLKDIFTYFEKVSSINNELKLVLRKLSRDHHELKSQIEDLKADNQLMMNLIKEAEDNESV